MRQRRETASAASKGSSSGDASEKSTNGAEIHTTIHVGNSRRSSFVWLALFLIITYCCSAIYNYQFQSMPLPLTAEQAGKRGFSEIEAFNHVKALTEVGPHPVGSEALHQALQYVLTACQTIKKTAHWEVDVEVDLFHAKSGANRLEGWQWFHSGKYYWSQGCQTPEEGAGDCSSCVGVMLELARGISQWAHGLKNAVIFLFNTGEEEGLNGAHSFIMQHPWSKTVRMAVDLEAMGIGGKSSIFQAGPHPWAIENFASAAKYPSGQIIAQDLFSSGAIKSATDFQVYKEVAGLSGLDFAYLDNTAVYHTKNDKLELLKKGSLQHLGENMLAFLLHIGASAHFPERNSTETEEDMSNNNAIYFDILGTYMVVYRQKFANMLHNSVIMQSLLIWITSLVMGGIPAAASLALSCLGVLLMWVFALSFSLLVGFLLPSISSSPVPYVSSPWLVVGLFGAPAFLGALTGQHLGYLLLQKYLLNVHSKRRQWPPIILSDLVKLEAERWLYKAGSFQWLILLIVGNYFKIGSSYLALFWLVSPAFAYGFFEATLAPARLPKPLKLATLILGLATPILISAGTFIRLAATVIGGMVRLDRNPGSTPEWLGNFMIAAFIAALLSLTLVYLLSYVHLSGAKRAIILATLVLFSLSLAIVLSGVVPPFSEDTARAVNVVHVVDATGRIDERQNPASYVSLFSTTPGNLNKEVEQINEGFVCGKDKAVDFVTFSVKYGCWTYNDTMSGWSETDIPTMQVNGDAKGNGRITQVSINTKDSVRWVLAINTEEIEDFKLKDTRNSEELISVDKKSSVDGWHTIQFSGGKNAPTLFDMTLYWKSGSTHSTDGSLLKLRTDVDRLTPITERVLEKLPRCSNKMHMHCTEQPSGEGFVTIRISELRDQSTLHEMRSIPLGTSLSPTPLNSSKISPFNINCKKSSSFPSWVSSPSHDFSFLSLSKSGLCRASQIVDLFPTVSPEIIVREARLEDCWEVAETHCSSFFPEYSFPLDFVLRMDRMVAMLAGFSIPNGCKRTCLVAVIGSSLDQTFLFGSEDFKIGGFDGKFSLNKGYVAGILTVDTVADFLPRKGPLRQRRTGIAYISNVAVREKFRQRGIAKQLVAKAESQARSWGCRAIALHCDLRNPVATKLYQGQGFKCIKVPEGAKWPQPKTSPDIKFNFMMKLLNKSAASKSN
ncbi:Peptidase M28 [Sesbania bispinosa]|nr:Peptidase M28 [Sesbania bispinosa]